MRVEPVKRRRQTDYPRAKDLAQTSLRPIPNRWAKNRFVLAALAGSGVLISCAHKIDEPVVSGDMPVPRLLTEADARQIWQTEAAKRGIKFKEFQYLKLALPNGNAKKLRTVSYQVDEIDPNHHIAFEYATQEDCRIVYGANSNEDPPDLAKDMKKALNKTPYGKHSLVVIENDDWHPSREEAMQKLEKQISEFFDWLKKEGVI